MKRLMLGCSAALVACLGAGVSAVAAGELTVKVTGVRGASGVVYVALQTRDGFMKSGAASGAFARPSGGDLTLRIREVPPGEYAVAVLHDTDGDRRMKQGAGGISSEGWGLSRGEQLRRKPTFDDVKILVPPGGAELTVRMQYPASPAPKP